MTATFAVHFKSCHKTKSPCQLGRRVFLVIATFAICPTSRGAEPPAANPPTATPPTTAAPTTTVKKSSRAGVDWPCFLGPTHDGRSSEVGIVTNWPAAGPPIVWQRKLGTGYGSPVTSAGRLFQFDRVADRERLVALESETGKQLWEFSYPTSFEDMYGYDNGPRGSPVIDDDRVYILGAHGMLHCLNVADGRQLWRLDTMKEYGVVDNFFGVGSTPLVEGDLLIVPVGGSPPEAQQVPSGQLDRVKGNNSAVVALDKLSGQPRYTLSDELASYASPVATTIGDRRWCFHFARGGLLGFDPRSGKLDFHFPWRATVLESVNASNPVVVGDLVFVSETYGPGGALLKVRPGGYDVVWSDAERRRDKALQTHWNTAVHHDGYLYASSGRHSENAELRCVELRTGRVMWSESELTRSSLLYVDGHFVCLTEYGELILLKATPERYTPIARVQPVRTDDVADAGFQPRPLLEYPAWAAPVLSHGLLYVRGRDRLVCYELIPAAEKP